MDRKTFLKHLAWASVAPFALSACGRSQSAPNGGNAAVSDTLNVHPLPENPPPIEMSTADWRSILSDDAFRILFEAGTEPRYSSPLLKEKRTGTYICKACRFPLFPSKTKFESGTGWPSFWAPLEGQVETKKDMKLGYPRTEYHCVRCEGHQGHVFDDGPDPTGLRYCNNGLALTFIPASEPLPKLRT